MTPYTLLKLYPQFLVENKSLILTVILPLLILHPLSTPQLHQTDANNISK